MRLIGDIWNNPGPPIVRCGGDGESLGEGRFHNQGLPGQGGSQVQFPLDPATFASIFPLKCLKYNVLSGCLGDLQRGAHGQGDSHGASQSDKTPYVAGWVRVLHLWPIGALTTPTLTNPSSLTPSPATVKASQPAPILCPRHWRDAATYERVLLPAAGNQAELCEA